MAGDIRLPYRHFERSPQIFVIRIQVVDVRNPPNGKPVISITFGHRPFTKIDAERRSGAFINRLLETLLPARLHAASALSAPAGHLPLERKAGDTGETCIANLRASPRFVILSGEKRRMLKNGLSEI